MDKAIIGFDKLYESHLKAQQGVTWKGSVANFSLHGIEQVLKLSNELTTGTYEPRPTVAFSITKPKPRDIIAIAYRDRVYQRSLNDNILYPEMVRHFIHENGACQTGKGTSFCYDRFRKNLRRFYINHGLNGFYLQIDVEKYYPSMDHATVCGMFRDHLDDEAYKAVRDVLDGQYEGDTGYNPGSQMVQIAGISFLNGIDHFIKEKLRIRNMVRVMDDIVMIHESRGYLEYCLERITEELAKLKLRPHPKKTRIIPLSEEIIFLGFRWRLTDTGKVLAVPKKGAVKNAKRSVEKLMRKYATGERSRRCVDESMRARLSHMENGNTHILRYHLTKWYNERMNYYEREKHRFLSQSNTDAGGARRDGEPAGGSRDAERNH